MIIAVTGASGHFGANLTLALIAQNHHVRALVHTDRLASEGSKFETFDGDIGDLDFLYRVFADVEVVYHSATHISLVDVRLATL